VIKVEKQVSITIDGEDVKNLIDVCELASRYIEMNMIRSKAFKIDKKWIHTGLTIGQEYNALAFRQITGFIGDIFIEI